MPRIVALTMLAVLALGQFAALSCPMGLASDGAHLAAKGDHRGPGEAHPASGHAGHTTADAGADASARGEGHGDHGDTETCRILMSCGALAVSDLPAARMNGSALPAPPVSSPVASLESFSPEMESPPPRHG